MLKQKFSYKYVCGDTFTTLFNPGQIIKAEDSFSQNQRKHQGRFESDHKSIITCAQTLLRLGSGKLESFGLVPLDFRTKHEKPIEEP